MNLVAELTGLRQFTLESRELPEPGPGEVQVQVAAVGICGSDMHSFAEGSVGDQICKYPMVLGHEPSGVVLKVGAGVHRLVYRGQGCVRTSHLLLPLRILYERPPQRLRYYSLHEFDGDSGFLP